jgi:hypothetical protein
VPSAGRPGCIPFRPDADDAKFDAFVQQLRRDKADMVLNHGSNVAYERLVRKARMAGLATTFLAVGVNLQYRPGEHTGSTFVDLALVTRDGRFLQ